MRQVAVRQRVCHSDITQESLVVEVDEQIRNGSVGSRQPVLLSIGQSHAVTDDVMQQPLDAVVAQLGEGAVVNASLSVKAIRTNPHPTRAAPVLQHPVSCRWKAEVAPR